MNNKLIQLNIAVFFGCLILSISESKAMESAAPTKEALKVESQIQETSKPIQTPSPNASQEASKETQEKVSIKNQSSLPRSKSQDSFFQPKEKETNEQEEKITPQNTNSWTAPSKSKLLLFTLGSGILAYLLYKIIGQNNTSNDYKKLD